jgi:hypothetical protein
MFHRCARLPVRFLNTQLQTWGWFRGGTRCERWKVRLGITLDAVQACTRLPHRVSSTMFLMFAGIAFLPCIVGPYAVTACSITRRTDASALWAKPMVPS